MALCKYFEQERTPTRLVDKNGSEIHLATYEKQFDTNIYIDRSNSFTRTCSTNGLFQAKIDVYK